MNSGRDPGGLSVALGCMGAALSCAAIVSSATGACYTHQCDASSKTLGSDRMPLGTWRIVGDCSTRPDCELVWVSSPTLGRWLDFPPQQTSVLMFPPLPTLPPGLVADFSAALPESWVASAPPNEPDANFIEGSGQPAEFGNISAASVSITNATCADYKLLVKVTVPVIATADAGSGPD